MQIESSELRTEELEAAKMRNNNQEIIRVLSKAGNKSNRTRNRILIGAGAFVTAAVFSVFSLAVGKVEADCLLYMRNAGTAAYTTLENASQEQYEEVKKLSYIKAVGRSVYFGNTEQFRCEVLDQNAWEKMQQPAYTDIEGQYPRAKDEIMLPVRSLQQMNIELPELGVDIDLEIQMLDGTRISETFCLSGYYTDYVDSMVGAPGGYFSEELLDEMRRPEAAQTTLLIQQDDRITGENIEEMLYRDVEMRDEKQRFWGGNSVTRDTVRRITGGFGTAAVLCVVILTAAGLLFYNVIQISMNREIRQYGLLKTIGMTRRQLWRMACRQAGRISLWSSLLGGILGSLIVCLVLPGFLSKLYLTGFGRASAMLIFRAELLIAAFLFHAAVTGVSYVFAMRKVIRMSPIEAANDLGSVKVKKTGRLLFSGRKQKKSETICLAWRNVRRFPKRSALMILSLSMALMVSLTMVVITKGTDRSRQIDYENSDFCVMSNSSALEINEYEEGTLFFSPSFARRITSLKGIAKQEITQGGYGKLSREEPALQACLENKSVQDGKISFVAQVVTTEYLEELRRFSESKGLKIDVDGVLEGRGAVILHYHSLSRQQEETGNGHIGEPIEIFNMDGEKTGSMEFSGYLDFKREGFPPLKTTWNSDLFLYLLVSEAGFQKMGLTEQIFRVDMEAEKEYASVLKETIAREIDKYNKKYVTTRAQYGGIIADNRTLQFTAKSELMDAEQNYIRTSRVVMGALSAILILMGLLHYVNITFSGLDVRKKEFAVMEHVGMTTGQLRNMLLFEGMFYSLIISLVTAAVGSVLWYCVGCRIQKKLAYFVFCYPAVELVLCIGALFGICMVVPLLLYKQFGETCVAQKSGGFNFAKRF